MNNQLIFSDPDLKFTGTVQVSVQANPSPLRLDYYIDNVFVVSKTVPPFNWSWNTTTVADGNHVVTASAVYKNNRVVKDSETVTVVNAASPPPDTTPPTVPGSFAKSTSTTTSITVGWTASTDAVGVVGYNVYRNGIFIVKLSASAISYTFDNLACGTSYSLSIEALDAAGNKSQKSTITASTSDCATPTPDVLYLSDLNPISAINGWGPYERDKSNGEALAGDGNTLTINGVTFSKGLGVHAFSELIYVLPDALHNRFKASVGIDDEAGTNGSAIFQVFDGATKVYDSGLMIHSDAARVVDVPISGSNQLRLVVSGGPDGVGWDHADWGNARVEISSVSPPPPPPPPPPSGTPIPSDGVIRSGGTYTSNFGNQITIATTSPVTLINCNLTYQGGTMIRVPSSGVDLTLNNCNISGASHRIVDGDGFKRFIMTNCTIEKTSGVTLVGNGELRMVYNKHHNIQRVSGGVGNFLQVRLFQLGSFEVAWNEIINEYNQSNPEDVFSIYHSSNTWWHHNYIQGQFHPGNGPGSSQNGITLDGYGGSGQPVDNNRIEYNILVRCLSIGIFPTSTGPARGNRLLNNRCVNAGYLDDGVTRNYYGYQGMSINTGGSDNQAHGNVLGTMKGTSQGSYSRGNDGNFAGETRGNGDGLTTGAWADNTHMSPIGGTITRAMEDAETDLWLSRVAEAGIVLGAR